MTKSTEKIGDKLWHCHWHDKNNQARECIMFICLEADDDCGTEFAQRSQDENRHMESPSGGGGGGGGMDNLVKAKNGMICIPQIQESDLLLSLDMMY